MTEIQIACAAKYLPHRQGNNAKKGAGKDLEYCAFFLNVWEGLMEKREFPEVYNGEKRAFGSLRRCLKPDGWTVRPQRHRVKGRPWLRGAAQMTGFQHRSWGDWGTFSAAHSEYRQGYAVVLQRGCWVEGANIHCPIEGTHRLSKLLRSKARRKAQDEYKLKEGSCGESQGRKEEKIVFSCL